MNMLRFKSHYVVWKQEFPNFPFEGTILPKRKMEIYGVCFSARGADDGANAANYIHTKYLKLMKGMTSLFDTTTGLYYQGLNVSTNGGFEAEHGFSAGGEGTDIYQREPLMFAAPLIFNEKDELNTYVVTEVATTPGTFLAKELEIAYIAKEIEL